MLTRKLILGLALALCLVSTGCGIFRNRCCTPPTTQAEIVGSVPIAPYAPGAPCPSCEVPAPVPIGPGAPGGMPVPAPVYNSPVSHQVSAKGILVPN
jgi:hypothetical protein